MACTCNSEELWQWFQDHLKQLDNSTKLMKCELPEEQRGKIFLNLETELLCEQPIVIRLGIQDIQPFSVFVSWQGRNRSGLYGYQIAYYSMDISTEVSHLPDFALFASWSSF